MNTELRGQGRSLGLGQGHKEGGDLCQVSQAQHAHPLFMSSGLEVMSSLWFLSCIQVPMPFGPLLLAGSQQPHSLLL